MGKNFQNPFLNMSELKEIPNQNENEKNVENNDTMPTTPSEAFDYLLSNVGNDGRWQWKITILCGICGLFTGMHNYGAVFLAATPNHWCDISNSSKYFNENINPTLYKEIQNISTPRVIGKHGVFEPSMCQYLDRELEFDVLFSDLPENTLKTSTYLSEFGLNHTWSNSSEEKKCSKWEYDSSVFNSTVVSEWDLVCDDQWLKPTIQATYMMGILTGAVVASAFSDRFGRRPATIGCAILFFFSSVIAAFSPNLLFFLIFRFITAAAGQGMWLINFVIVMEIAGLARRDLFGNFFHTFFGIGMTGLATFSYFLRSWRSLQLAIGAPTVLLLGYYWLMPESPRWLLMNGKTKKGIVVLEEVGKCNGGKQLPDEEKVQLALDIIQKEVILQKEKYGISFSKKLQEYFQNIHKLVRTPNMRRRSLITFFCWFVVSMCSYGLGFSGENLNVSLHVYTSLSIVLALPSCLLCIYTAIRFGRRVTLAYSMIIGGICCLSIALVPTELKWVNLTLLIVGRFNLGIAFRSVFFLSTELVPTDIRNNSIGMASMFARIGSGLAPYIVDLLGNVYYAIPSTIFGLLCITAGCLACLLPETAKQRLPETIAEIEKLPK